MNLKELKNIIKNEGETLINKTQIAETEKEKILLRAVKLNEEVGELCEEILKKFGNQRKEKKFDDKNLRGEFADVIITLMLLADKMDIDVEEALEEKVNYIVKKKLKE
ncbi:MAG: hypothetical protein KKB62_03085 [Nanoarchaeota archaeon]|nr:hypothetical protein [Nanoarchaeota archaeon]